MSVDPILANSPLKDAANLIGTYHRDSGSAVTTFSGDNPDTPVIIVASGSAKDVLLRAVGIIKEASEEPQHVPIPPRPDSFVAQLLQRALAFSHSAVFAPQETPTAPLGTETPSPANHPQQPGAELASQHSESCSTKEETAKP